MELIKIHQHLYFFLSLKYTDINAVVHAVKTNGGQMKIDTDLSTMKFIRYVVQFNGK